MRRGAFLCAALASLIVTCGSQPAPTDPVARGQQLYRTVGCVTCHDANSAGQRKGPALDHIGSVAATRRAGMRADEYIRQSILDPGAYVVPGFEDFAARSFDRPLPPEDLDALVAYLVSLR